MRNCTLYGYRAYDVDIVCPSAVLFENCRVLDQSQSLYNSTSLCLPHLGTIDLQENRAMFPPGLANLLMPQDPWTNAFRSWPPPAGVSKFTQGVGITGGALTWSSGGTNYTINTSGTFSHSP
jgi:hypothetical protein